ncbi:MAG: hypothetical protein V3V62_10810 [bacterium]
MNDKSHYESYGHTRKKSLPMRMIFQVARFALVALFLYIAYLGVMWRGSSITAQKAEPPRAPSPAAPPSR